MTKAENLRSAATRMEEIALGLRKTAALMDGEAGEPAETAPNPDGAVGAPLALPEPISEVIPNRVVLQDAGSLPTPSEPVRSLPSGGMRAGFAAPGPQDDE